MKKLAILILILLSGTVALWSQDIQFGPTFGTNYSYFSFGDDPHGNEPVLGYNIGLQGDFYLKNHFYLSTGLNFEFRTYHKPVFGSVPDDGSINDTEWISLMTIALPLKYKFGKNEQFYLYTGPYLGYVLNRENTLRIDNQEIWHKDITDTFYRYQFGLLVGIGYCVAIANNISMVFDADYSESLIRFGKAEYKESWKGREIRSRIGILFTIK